MKITYYGHSCFEVEIKGTKFLFDPFITPNELAKHIDISTINPDYILISHGHEDHLADAVAIAKQSGATVVGVFEITAWAQKQGIEKVWPMNTGGSKKFGEVTVKLVPAEHSSSFPDGSYAGNPVGFLLKTDSKNIYFAGDTALTSEMQLLGEYNAIHLAMLPIGDNFTMGITDVIVATELLRCNKVLGMHYDTFPFIKIDKEKAAEAFKKAGKELILLNIGETLEL